MATMRHSLRGPRYHRNPVQTKGSVGVPRAVWDIPLESANAFPNNRQGDRRDAHVGGSVRKP